MSPHLRSCVYYVLSLKTAKKHRHPPPPPPPPLCLENLGSGSPFWGRGEGEVVIVSPPRRGRSPPLVASPLFFLPALFLLCPTDACEETITQFHLAAGGGGGGGGRKKRERGDRKEKKKEPMQIKTKKVFPLLSFPFPSFSPSSLAQRGRRDDKNKCKPGRRGRREGKKRRGEFVGWRNWVMGAERGKGGEGTKIGRRKRSEDDKKRCTSSSSCAISAIPIL